MKGILASVCVLALIGTSVFAQQGNMPHNDMFYHHHPDIAMKELSNQRYAQPNQAYANYGQYDQSGQRYAQPNNNMGDPSSFGPVKPPQRYGHNYAKRDAHRMKKRQGYGNADPGGTGQVGLIYDKNGNIDWDKSKATATGGGNPPPRQLNNAYAPPQQQNQRQQSGGIVYDENGSIDWAKSNRANMANANNGGINMAAAAPQPAGGYQSADRQQPNGYDADHPYQGNSHYGQDQGGQQGQQPDSYYGTVAPQPYYSSDNGAFGGSGGNINYNAGTGASGYSGNTNYGANAGNYNNNAGGGMPITDTSTSNVTTSKFAAGIRLAGTLPDDGYFRGEGTFYDLETHVGTCSHQNKNSELVAALNSQQMGDDSRNNENCGKDVEITGPFGKTVQVTIVDNCKTCKEYGLDLSPAAFQEVGDFSHGSIPIKWKFI